MVLLLDLGNTNLYAGVYSEGKLVAEFRKHTDLYRSSDEYAEILRSFLNLKRIDIASLEGAVLSSVIPSLSATLKRAAEMLIGKECKVVSKNLKSGLAIRIDNPGELGSDLVADCIGALKRYSSPCIIADLGTANKLLVVDRNGDFVGCTIGVGLKIGMKALASHTAQLMDVSLVPPAKVIGKNSPDSLNSGATYGTCCLLEGMANRIEKELGYPCRRILTGGNAALIKDIIDPSFLYDPTLILEGLYQIYLKNK